MTVFVVVVLAFSWIASIAVAVWGTRAWCLDERADTVPVSFADLRRGPDLDAIPLAPWPPMQPVSGGQGSLGNLVCGYGGGLPRPPSPRHAVTSPRQSPAGERTTDWITRITAETDTLISGWSA